jgi:hypothetical protein
MMSVVGLNAATSTSGEGFFILDFLATHPPVFANATNPLEADSWLRTTESKFGQLHYIEY